MNFSHFHRQPLFTFFGVPQRGHELFTSLEYLDPDGKPAMAPLGHEHCVIRCSCGWLVKRELWEMYKGRDRFFDELGEAARRHVWPPPATLAELTEWGWFDPEA